MVNTIKNSLKIIITGLKKKKILNELAREKMIGWYHSGPKLRASDLEINELFKRYTPNPVLVIVDVEPKDIGIPTDAYFAIEEIKDVSEDSLKVVILLNFSNSEILIIRMEQLLLRHLCMFLHKLMQKNQKK